MSIKKIQIRNLLSYRSIDIELGDNLNIIVGKNGSGKSNFVNALLFVLTDKFQYHDKKMLENNILQDDKQPIQVQLIIDNQQRQLPITSDEVSITRQFSTKDEYFIGGKSVSINQFNNLIQCMNLSRTNYYNIIRQGKILKISQMQDRELYELLEEVSGIKLYEEKKAEAMHNVELAVIEKDEIVKLLNELSVQIKQLQDEKDAFNQLKEIQKQIQLHEIQLAQISAKNFQHQLLDLNTEQSKLHNQLQNLNNQENEIRNNFYKLTKEVELYEQCIFDYQQKQNSLQFNIKQLKQQEEELNQKLEYQLQQIQSYEEDMNEPQQDLKKKEKQINQQLIEIQEQYADIEKDIQFLQILQTEDPIKRIKEEVLMLQQQLNQYESEYKNVESKIHIINKELNRLKDQSKQNQDPLQLKQKMTELDKELIIKNRQFEEQAQNSLITSKTKTQLQQKLLKLQSDVDIESNQLDKSLKDIYTLSIFKIFDFAQSQNLHIYGVFASLIKIQNERLITLIETASGPRMFALIVPDSQTAKQIIDFNKEQQGCALRIYPLDLIEDKIQQYETPRDTIDLVSQVTFTIEIPKEQALKQRIIGRWVAVKDYDMALSVSQKYDINCITMENEVVYSDSFISRIGATRQQQSKSAQFKKIIEMNGEIKVYEQKDKQLQKQIDDDSNIQLEIQREIQNIKNQLNQLNEQLRSQDIVQIQKKQNEIDGLENLAKQLDIPIQQIVQKIRHMQAQLKHPKQLKKGLTDDNLERLQELLKEKQILAQQISKIYMEKNELKIQQNKKPEIDQQKVAQQQKQIDELKDQLKNIKQKILNYTQQDKEIEQELNQNNNLLKKQQKQKEQIKMKIDEIMLEIDSIKNQQIDLESQAKQCINKLENFEKEKKMIDALDQIEEEEENNKQISKNQIIKKIKELKSRFNHKFTQKDQSLFEKLNDIEIKFHEYQDKLSNLKRTQQEFEELCIFMDKKAETILSDHLFKKFAEYFRYYFMKIVPSGECQIRLIKGLKKNKKNWGIDIKISFKSKEVQNWTQFSSGEKTIVAFVIVVALQKCDPAPFYILDEFDAALDDNYRIQIAEIIQELSEQNQYIIVTFRQELVQLNNDKIKYFKVQHHNQQSSLVKTTQTEAKKIIRS